MVQPMDMVAIHTPTVSALLGYGENSTAVALTSAGLYPQMPVS